MPKTRSLTKLFRAIGSNDLALAADAARQLAAQHGQRGQFQAEKDLLGALNSPRSMRNAAERFQPSVMWDVQSALLQLPTPRSLSELTLPKKVFDSLSSLMRERSAGSRLAEHGIPRRWKVLFHGPPGCGKTAAATALAHDVGLPAFLVRFDGLIGAYLGQTAMRLREVFRFVTATPSVVIFDEIDALAKRRGSPMDVGELDRIVIAFLQELEYANSDGFVIGSSNLPQALDDALWRRFDLRLQFPKPSAAALQRFSSKRSNDFGMGITKAILAECAKASSFAEAEQIIVDRVRERIVSQP